MITTRVRTLGGLRKLVVCLTYLPHSDNNTAFQRYLKRGAFPYKRVVVVCMEIPKDIRAILEEMRVDATELTAGNSLAGNIGTVGLDLCRDDTLVIGNRIKPAASILRTYQEVDPWCEWLEQDILAALDIANSEPSPLGKLFALACNVVWRQHQRTEGSTFEGYEKRLTSTIVAFDQAVHNRESGLAAFQNFIDALGPMPAQR